MTISELGTFLQKLVSDLSGKLVIFQQQNAPKPGKPYLAIRLFAFRGIGMDEYLPGVQVGEQIVSGPREVTLEIHWVGDGGIDGLHHLEQSMWRQTTVDRCFASGVSVFHSENIQDISGLMDGVDWEKRYSLDLQVRLTQQTIDNPGVIEEVNIDAFGDGTVINIDGRDK